MLENLGKQHQAKARDIFLLALNYHSVDGGDFSERDKKILCDKLLADWKKIDDKLVSNGHKSVSLIQVQSLDNAHDVAYNVLNHIDKIKNIYGL